MSQVILDLFALKGEDRRGPLSIISEQDDAGFLNVVHDTLDVHISNRLEEETVQNRINGYILMLYRHLGDEIVRFKEITIHVSLYTSPLEIALKSNVVFSLVIH